MERSKRRHTDFESWDKLRECDEEEVEIEEELELFVEDQGKECECVVLLVSYNIRGKASPQFLYIRHTEELVRICSLVFQDISLRYLKGHTRWTKGYRSRFILPC